MKRSLSTLMLTILLAFMAVVTSAQAPQKTKQYKNGMFKDVAGNAWYAQYVKEAYEYGLVSGTASDIMSPDGTVTVGQAVTVAARIHAAFNGKQTQLESSAEGTNWYDKYVTYAIANKVATEGQFDDYTRPVTRIETAVLLHDAVGTFKAINNISSIPDLAAGKEGADKVLTLYRAGVLTGNDAYGYFAPETNLKRSELCALITRASNSEKCVKTEFKVLGNRPLGDAYYIMETLRPTSSSNGLANAWEYDNRFDYYSVGERTNLISDASDVNFYTLRRQFKTENEGILHFELVLNNTKSGDKGVYVSFNNTDDKKILNITPENGVWTVEGKTKATTSATIDNLAKKKVIFEVDIDLDKNTASVLIDQTEVVSVELEESNLRSVKLGTEKKGVGAFALVHAVMTKNYVVSDDFIAKDELVGKAPKTWETTGFTYGKMASATYSLQDSYSLKVYSQAGQTSTAYKSFEAIAGDVRFEAMVLLPEAVDGAKISLTNNKNEVFTLVTKGNALYYGNTKVHTYAPNVWMSIRVEADTKTGTAKIKINGKDKAIVNFSATTFNGVKFDFAPNTSSDMWIDDVRIYTNINYSDYPSAPVVAESTDYNVGMLVCNLWRDTTANEGWFILSAFEEFDPYLGYYDEGLEEVADWENKWMAEHGVDFTHICWYAPVNNVNQPIKTPRNMEALHRGYMNSRYGDYVDFSIMLENNTGAHTSYSNFIEYVWPYWVEYYFKDDRYARIENKAVLSIFDYNKFVDQFGGEATVMKLIQFMDQDIKKYGYDGVLMLSSVNGAFNNALQANMQRCGFDGGYAYNWHRPGWDPQYQMSKNIEYANLYRQRLHNIPVVSVGFNDVARNKVRSPIITAQGFGQVCNSIKSILSRYNTGTWKDNTVMLSTWNEYSEGTYISPTNSNGFDYLEEVRKAFTNDKSDHSKLDVKPADRILDRMSHMFPDNYATVRHLQYEDPNNQGLDMTSLEVKKSLVVNTDSWMPTKDTTSMRVMDGALAVNSTTKDGGIIPKSTLESFKADDVIAIRVRMRVNADANAQIFFTTQDDTVWSEQKSAKTAVAVNGGQYVDYYFDFSDNDKWNGTITSLRIDPLDVIGTAWIESIELLGIKKNGLVPNVYINTVKLETTFPVKITDDNDYLVYAMEEDTTFAKLRLFYEYDRVAGTLVLHTYDEQKLELTVGKDTAVHNGKTIKLGYTFELFDGLPVFHLKKLCDIFGYKYTVDSKGLNIVAATTKEYNEYFVGKIPNTWEFNAPGSFDGWKPARHCSLESEDAGFMTINAEGSDPQMVVPVDIKATDYSKIVVGVKNAPNVASQTPEIYFVTSKDSGFAAERIFKSKYDTTKVNSDGVVEAVFDLSTCKYWQGQITQLRFDPLAITGKIEIDYIRFIK